MRRVNNNIDKGNMKLNICTNRGRAPRFVFFQHPRLQLFLIKQTRKQIKLKSAAAEKKTAKAPKMAVASIVRIPPSAKITIRKVMASSAVTIRNTANSQKHRVSVGEAFPFAIYSASTVAITASIAEITIRMINPILVAGVKKKRRTPPTTPAIKARKTASNLQMQPVLKLYIKYTSIINLVCEKYPRYQYMKAK